MPQRRSTRKALQYVAAGVLYLLLSAVVFVVWLALDGIAMLLLAVALSTIVAGLVELTVGWHQLRRDRTHAP